MKICTSCQKDLLLTSFFKYKRSKDGLMSRCKNCSYIMVKRWEQKNKDKNKAIKKKSREKNIDKFKASFKKWTENNRDTINSKRRAYNKKNRDKTRAVNAKQRAKRLHRIPKWLSEKDLEIIQTFYTKAHQLTIETGIPHEVDHIVPLQGKNISGLHVPWNLQIITESENCRKRNKYES